MHEKSIYELHAEPIHQVISNVINRAHDDEDSCCVVSLAFTLTLWQLRGKKMTDHVPSTMLISSGDIGKDPIDHLIKSLIDDPGSLPGAAEKNELLLKPEQVEPYLAATIAERRLLDPQLQTGLFAHANEHAVWHAKNFMKAIKQLSPGGRIKSYATAWHKKYGLTTEFDDEVILRLNTKNDCDAFKKDVLNHKDKLISPEGIGFAELRAVAKSCSFSGALTLDSWDDAFVDSIIALGLPIMFLPHTVKDSLKITNMPALLCFESMLSQKQGQSISTSLSATPNPCFESHVNLIRKRLHRLPGNGTYEFAILQVLHQIGNVCFFIACDVHSKGQSSIEQSHLVYWDLYTRAIRAIYIGIVSLGWHALGFHLPCPRPIALKVLKRLRSKGPMKTNEMQKFTSLSEVECDTLLQSLCSEELIQVEDGTAKAVSFDDFIKLIHARANIVRPEYSRDLLRKSKQS